MAQGSNGEMVAQTAHLQPIVRAHGQEQTINHIGKPVHERARIQRALRRAIGVQQPVEQVFKLVEAIEDRLVGLIRCGRDRRASRQLAFEGRRNVLYTGEIEKGSGGANCADRSESGTRGSRREVSGSRR